MKSKSAQTALLNATAIALMIFPVKLVAQQIVTVAPATNTEPDTAPAINSSGFVFSIDGAPVNADPVIEDRIRRTDIALANADVQVQYNGLTPTPRLNIEMARASAYGPGALVDLRTETNYPAFISRGEIRLYDQSAIGGARLLQTVPVEPNRAARVTVPNGANVVAVYRVYDGSGRYDETAPLSLATEDRRGLTDNEDGMDATAVRNIRVSGGELTVSANNLARGATLYTLGEAIQADGQGRLVIDRILPPGNYAVDVAVRGAGQNTELSRQLNVPGSEWFYVGSGELTYSGIGSTAGPETTGRLSFYVDGKTAGGLEVTGSLDTGNGDIDTLFSRLDARDPQSLAERLALGDAYPTFGDDGTLMDNTPTSGRVYLRVQQNNNFLVWGDYQARLAGSSYIRNERTLYGAQIHLETQGVTSHGEARASLDLYAAQPDQLVGRDAFRGTGGSVYFLSGDSVAAGTATVTVEQRDADTNRILDRRTLIEGRDYEIDYIQGVIILKRPLVGSISDGLIQGNPGGDTTVNLVAQYEYTPTGVSVDGLSFGGRAEGWLTDNLRIGITAIQDETGASDYHSEAVDLRYTFGENSFVELDHARTEGSTFASIGSLDAGLILDTQDLAVGSGEATRIMAQADFADMGLSSPGTFGGYYEERTEGFSTLDYQVTATTGDETLFGAFLNAAPRDGLSYALSVDAYENSVGDERFEVGAEAAIALSDQLHLAAGLEYLDEITATTDGTRVDLGLRLTYSLSQHTDIYVFGQQAVATDGLDEFNRTGLGLEHAIDGWTVSGELSDGTGGIGGALRLEQKRGSDSTYFGYELDPGRALNAGVSQADNGGKFVLGGRRELSDDLSVFGENVYDIFGTQRSLTSAYGVNYQATDYLSYSAGLTFGQVEDDTNGNFDRHGVSLGLRYADAATTARILGEIRIDHADGGSTRTDSETFILAADVAHKFDDASRVLVALRAAQTNNADTPDLDGRYVQATLGYALRPILDERFNMLAQVRYLSDDYGQTVDGVAGAGDVQDSIIFSVDGNYDLNERWTIGAKMGYRKTDSGPDRDNMVSNDAYLAVANARFHVVNDWDVLLEVRQFGAMDAGTTQTGFLGAIYKQVGRGTQIGVGYNFGSFSDDLTDLTTDDGGAFINIVASF